MEPSILGAGEIQPSQQSHRAPLDLCINSILSHASETKQRVRYSLCCFSSFSFRTRKVSPGKSGPYKFLGSRI